jgi:D-amino-acid dehydrogenase
VLFQKNNTQQSLSADVVILAAGSWSPELAQLAGTHLPLMPGKGYSMDLTGTTCQLNYPCILVEAKVALTPWNNRLRIGSTMEIGAINNKILLKRAQGILEAVPRFLPTFQKDPAFKSLQQQISSAPSGDAVRDKVWFGFRPVSADGMPIVGFASSAENLIMATGHAMLGLSLGPGTGKLVAELACNESTTIPVNAFRVQRFS